MAIADKIKEVVQKKPPTADEYVQLRLRRGEARKKELAPQRNECWQFFRGNTYVWRTQENQLVTSATSTSIRGKGKERWRARTTRAILTPLVRQEVSYAKQRTPSYDVLPTNSDPDTRAAAKVSEMVALYGHEAWGIEQVMDDVATSAIVADCGFAGPYWDSDTGAVIDVDENGKAIREGEIRIRTYTANEVGWEPGVRFDDSRWHFIQQARPLVEVERMCGFKLSANGTDRQVIGTGKPTSNTELCIVTEYLERPSAKFPKGRRLVLAEDKQIMPEEPYPLQDSKGQVVDEVCLLKLSVITDPDSDHDHGLVKFSLDPIRTYQDCVNKQLEFKNHMVPQLITRPGNLLSRVTDEPNLVIEAQNPDQIKFRETPGMPAALSEIQDRAKADLAFIWSQNDIPSQVESGRGIQALLDRDQNVRAGFLKNLAGFYGKLMHRCLGLVQLYYTEPRDLMIVGEFGPDYLHGFLGANLLHQTQVRVLPQSLEARTRDQVKQDVIQWAQLGWITPEEAMSAIQVGTTDQLGAGYEYDRARAWLIIQKIKDGPEALFSMPQELKDIQVPGPMEPVLGPDGPQIDPATGAPQMQPGQPQMQTIEVPGWMPRQGDNIRIHKAVFAAWMKSADWMRADHGMREAARQYLRALDDLEAEEAARMQAQQTAAAQGLGAANAAKPQFSPMPSLANPAAGEPGSQG